MAGSFERADRTRQPADRRGEFRRLLNVLESQFTEADASMYQVGEQRERNHRFYALQPIGNEIRGRSHYISPDVLDVVESKKSYLSRTFLSGRRIAKFKAGDQTPQIEADKRTAYVEKQLKKNRFFELLRDFWHDAQVAKRGVFLVEWLDDEEEYLQQVPGVPIAQIQQAIASDPKIIDIAEQNIQVQQSPQGPVASGSLTLVKDTSKVNVKLVQPERFFRDPHRAYVHQCAYAGYEEDLTRTDLINMGYDPNQVSRIDLEYRFRREEEDSQRKAHDQSWIRRRLHNRPRTLETVTLFKTWTWLDMSEYMDMAGIEVNRETQRYINTDALALYEIHWTKNEILRWADGSVAIREVSEIPFFEWTEHKISHAEHGLASADVLAHTQRANSVLKRLILDNQQIRNTTRYEAVSGAVKNPRELLDNNIGGVVWTRRAGSITPLAAPELSPLTFQTVEMLDQDKEERGGVSRLAQGLNQDAVSHQNADRMIERLTGLGNERNARMARDFAETLLIPLMQYIYRLGVRNDQQSYMVEAGGSWHNIQPMAWEDVDWDMEVHVALTPEEGMKYAQSLLMLHQLQSQDPQLAMMYGFKEKHALIDSVYDALGVTDSSQFLMRPDSPQFMQAMQGMQMQQQEMKMLGMQTQKFQMWLAQSAEGRQWYEAQLKGLDTQTKAADRAQDNQREDAKFKHAKIIDYAELRLEREQQRAAKIGGGSN